MSRNGSGTYTLPSGNPVVSGTLIEASWANTTLDDLASAMTDSLSRTGQGGMQAALRLYDGTSSVPGLAWGSETTTGWYRAGAGDMRLVVTGSQVVKYLATGVDITGTLSASGNTTVGGTLGVTGASTFTGAATFNGGISGSPVINGGTANGVAYLNGSKVLTTGSALTFDGTTLTVGGATGVFKLNASSSDYSMQRLQVAGTTYGSFGAGTGGEVVWSANGLHLWNVASSEQMRLTSTGLLVKTSTTPSGSAALTLNSGNGVQFAATGGGGNITPTNNGGLQFFTYTGAIGSESYTERMRLDTSGNLGLGVTPSAWSVRAIQVPNNYAFSHLGYSNNAFFDGAWKYLTTAAAAIYQQTSGQHAWYTAPSGTAGNAISFTQAMTLDASGNLGIGTTSPANLLHVNGSNSVARFSGTSTALSAYQTFFNNSAAQAYFGIESSSGTGIIGTGSAYGMVLATASTNPLCFGTNGSERARIDSSGNVGIGTSSPANYGASYKTLAVNGDSAGGGVFDLMVNGTRTGTFYAVASEVAYGSITNVPVTFRTNNTERMRIDSSGNLLVGASSGFGRFNVKTTDTSAGTWGVYMRNSADSIMFAFLNNGNFYTGNGAGSPYNNTTGSAANCFINSDNGLLQRSTSSIKYKTDVQDATHGLADVMALRPVTYKGKNDGDTVFGGLIAEEVHEAGLTEFVQYAKDGSPDALAYGNMVSLCIKAIQEQQTQISDQLTIINAQQAELNSLKARLDAANL